MDERQLKDILGSEEIPPAEDNARKQAINLALAAFDDAQQDKRKSRQGFRFPRRLTGRSNSPTGRRPMRTRYVFGGAATATAVVLGIGIYGMLDGQVGTQLAYTSEQVSNELAKVAEPESRVSKIEKKSNELASVTGSVSRALKIEQEMSANLEVDAPSRQDDKFVVGGLPSTAPVDRSARGEPQRLSLERQKSSVRVGRTSFRASQTAARIAAASRPVEQRADERIRKQFEATGRDQFADVEQNTVKRVADTPVSTFSIDVDTAAYSFVRRMLNRGVLPQKNSVRIEELVNYFQYDYPTAATTERPFQPTVTVIPSPWKKGNKLIHIGIKGYDLERAEAPRSNLVFLLDVSGSMSAADKLPLVVNSMKLLLETLRPDDTVAIVVYAGAAGTVLEPTKVAEKRKILAALDRLRAGGSTAGAAGIRQAYALAEGSFDEKAVNRVILATDGDFNVGITNREELKGFVERKRKSGVLLSVLGFGQGNLDDHLMQILAQNGNGVAAHIDTLNEARKVLVEEASSTLFPIAKDVKIQVEFNPKRVAEYRLIGYETRALKREDFNNDQVDAGDIGAGHAVTAIYEITPVGGEQMIGDRRYQKTKPATRTRGASDLAGEYAFLKIRYKQPDADTSRLISTPITASDEIAGDGEGASVRQLREARWATAVAAFGQLLKGGKYTGRFSYEDVIAMARAAKGEDEFGYRAEFINLVRLARSASALPRN